MTFTHAIIPANTVVSNSADAKMPAKENNSLLGNSAAVVQQAPFRAVSAQTGKTFLKPFGARSSVVPTIQAILAISWITDPKVWLEQGSAAPDWKEDKGYNLHRWGDLMEVMEVNSSSSSIGTHQQQQLQQQQQAPDHLRPAPRGQAPAHASIRSNGQWKNNNAKGGSNYNSNRQQQQQAPKHLRPAPRGQAPAHAGMEGWSVVSRRK